MAKRLRALGIEKYKYAFKVSLHEDALKVPYTWKMQKIAFVNSMSDLFHKDVPLEFIKKVFKVMNENPQHTFQVLTKRPDKLVRIQQHLQWTHYIWMGVSVDDARVLQRIDLLRLTHARSKFLSCEPLIGPLPNMNLDQIDSVIVGGESGQNARPIHEDWVLDIMDQCNEANFAYFYKQCRGTNKKKNGRLLNGRTYDEMPTYRTEEL